MQLGERLGNGKAEPRALMSLGDVALDLLERAPQPGHAPLREIRAVDAEAEAGQDGGAPAAPAPLSECRSRYP